KPIRKCEREGGVAQCYHIGAPSSGRRGPDLVAALTGTAIAARTERTSSATRRIVTASPLLQRRSGNTTSASSNRRRGRLGCWSQVAVLHVTPMALRPVSDQCAPPSHLFGMIWRSKPKGDFCRWTPSGASE